MSKSTEAIMKLLISRLNIDVSVYEPAFIERIIKSRIAQKEIVFFEDYLNILEENNTELEELNLLFHINYTRFFRNHLTFAFLESIIMPEIIKTKALSRHPLRIWSAGCATGEEPYSIAILLLELQKSFNKNIPIEFIATDISDKALEKAVKGVYLNQTLQNIKFKYIEKYFHKSNNEYTIKDIVKNDIVFENYNLNDNKTTSPAGCIFGNFDLISCRNVLIYMNKQNQELIFEKIYKTLEKNGVLLLGKSEFISGPFQKYFEKINKHCPIYKKIK